MATIGKIKEEFDIAGDLASNGLGSTGIPANLLIPSTPDTFARLHLANDPSVRWFPNLNRLEFSFSPLIDNGKCACPAGRSRPLRNQQASLWRFECRRSLPY